MVSLHSNGTVHKMLTYMDEVIQLRKLKIIRQMRHVKKKDKSFKNTVPRKELKLVYLYITFSAL